MKAPLCVVRFPCSPGCRPPVQGFTLTSGGMSGNATPGTPENRPPGCIHLKSKKHAHSLGLIWSPVEAAVTLIRSVFTAQAIRALKPDHRQTALNNGGRQKARPPWSDAAVLARAGRCCTPFRSVGIFNMFFRFLSTEGSDCRSTSRGNPASMTAGFVARRRRSF